MSRQFVIWNLPPPCLPNIGNKALGRLRKECLHTLLGYVYKCKLIRNLTLYYRNTSWVIAFAKMICRNSANLRWKIQHQGSTVKVRGFWETRGFIPKPWFSSCNREKSSFRKAKYIIYYIHIYHIYLSRFKTSENICFLEACAVRGTVRGYGELGTGHDGGVYGGYGGWEQWMQWRVRGGYRERVVAQYRGEEGRCT